MPSNFAAEAATLQKKRAQNKKNLFFFYAECQVTSPQRRQRYKKTSAEQKRIHSFYSAPRDTLNVSVCFAMRLLQLHAHLALGN